jgi:HD-GYP domain-containing protein (c-di-GMP phosphodiesterase class II)
MAEPDLPVPVDDPLIARTRQRAAEILTAAQALVVTSEPTKIDAVEALSAIARVKHEAEQRRDELVRPHNDYVKRLNALFRNVLGPIVQADMLLRARVQDFNTAQRTRAAEQAAAAERARLEVEARLKEAAAAEARGDRAVAGQLFDRALVSEAQAGQAQADAVHPARSVSTPLGGAQTRLVWTFSIEALERVPPSYLQVNETAVRRAINEGVREIAGLRIFQTDQLAVRR